MKITKFLTATLSAALLGGFCLTAAAQSDAAGLATNFLVQAAAYPDTRLGSIASNLVVKINAFNASTGTNSTLTNRLDNLLQSLNSGHDAAGLTNAFKLASGVKLTSDQASQATQIGHLAAAFVTERNFSAVPGAGGSVSNLVNSFVSGKVSAVTAAPAIQNLSTNAALTVPQKQLLTDLANQYVPGMQKVTGAVQDVFKKIPGF